MRIEIIVPAVGESITEALLAQWFKNDGDMVKKDEPLFVIETDKVTLEVAAEADGRLSITVPEGETIAIGSVVGAIDTGPAGEKAPQRPAGTVGAKPSEAPAQTAPPESSARPSKPTAPAPAASGKAFAPSVRRLLNEHNLDFTQITGSGPAGRLTKGDVLLYLESRSMPAAAAAAGGGRVASPSAISTKAEEQVTRTTMSPIRQRIAARLLEAKQNTAMLTTFNEVDMQPVMDLRQRYKEVFKQKHGVALGFMSFFIKASVEALKEFPMVNAYLEGNDIIEHHYYHVGIAVGAERGLVVPVIRHADQLSFAELEKSIIGYVEKITANRLELTDLEGGTFTISNGGVYGSLLSTPILNMPQSAILGMHKIEKRPVVIDEAVVIRSMMYVALSYDHRIVDGRQAVGFLKRIKQCVEDPQRIIMEI
jgi:2-oxoglutarate dehydrogenase E2 component (dihydrolipoamide succinyltransferase)